MDLGLASPQKMGGDQLLATTLGRTVLIKLKITIENTNLY